MAFRTQIAATLLLFSTLSWAAAFESENTTSSPKSFNTVSSQIDGVFARADDTQANKLVAPKTTAELNSDITESPRTDLASDSKSPTDSTNQTDPLSAATETADDIRAATPDLAAASQQAELLQQALLKIYRSNLLKKTYRHVQYPASSIERNEEGDVILLVEILRNGKVKNIRYKAKAHAQALNLAARSAVKQARPFSAAPSALEGDSFKISMPIRFRLTE